MTEQQEYELKMYKQKSQHLEEQVDFKNKIIEQLRKDVSDKIPFKSLLILIAYSFLLGIQITIILFECNILNKDVIPIITLILFIVVFGMVIIKYVQEILKTYDN